MKWTLIYAILCLAAACALVAVHSSELDAGATAWEQVVEYTDDDAGAAFVEVEAGVDAGMEAEDAAELALDDALELAAENAADVAATIAPHEMEAYGIGEHPTAFSSFNSISEQDTIALIEEARAFLSETTTPSKPAPYVSPVAKAAAAKALASGKVSSGNLKLRPASVRGAEEETKQKYKRFVSLHPKRARANVADDYRNFKSNRAKVIALNDKYGTASNPTPFKSSSPWANLSPAEFKKRFLTTHNHSKRKSKGNGVYKSKNVPASSGASAKSTTTKANKSVKVSGARKTASQVAKKGGKSLLEMGQSDPVKTGGGGRVGGAGGSSQKSGKTGGSGGGDVKKSGKTGGNGGSTVDKSGKTGGGGQVGSSAPPSNFTPLTAADIKNSMLSANVNPGNLESVLPWFAQRGAAVPTDPVNDQGECGSCWAQVASQAIFRRQSQGIGTNTPRNFPSVQQILDCVKTDLSGGCAGGTPMDALEWTSKNPMASEYSYPLLGGLKTGTCQPSSEKTVPFKSFGWENAVPACTTPNCENQQRMETILLRSMKLDGKRPIIYVHSANWSMYSGGIFPVSLCSSTLDAGDHVVELWSFGQDANGVPYWIVRNSWGSKWGVNGFIYLPFGVNACGMANFAILPTSPY